VNTPGEGSRKLEILLAEDNAADLLLLTRFLKESSVKNHVNVARDGQMALDYLRRVNGFENAKRPHLVLLDLSLPRVDGREVLNEVKRDPDLRSIPVIVMTGSCSSQEILSVYQSHADYCMIKPEDLEQYASSVKYLEEVWLKTLSGEKARH
jgi:two-component system, chemotaxis family, response regulator Rcp1